MCTWHLETLDAEPVQNMAIPLSYSERGNLSIFDFLLTLQNVELIHENSRETIILLKVFIAGRVYWIKDFNSKGAKELHNDWKPR